MNFLIFNGKICDIKDVNSTIILADEQFKIYQRIWFGYGGIPLLNENLDLLIAQLEYLNMPLPKEFENRKELFRLTKRVLNKNRLFRSGYINFQVWSNRTESHTLITPLPLQGFDFPFPDDGMLITYSGQRKYSRNELNSYPFYNKPIWDAVFSETAGTHYRNALILNENNKVCECAFANIFLIKNGQMITPALSSGCYRDILRDLILEAAKRAGIMTRCQDDINKSEPAAMDEIFFASEQAGFCRILGIDNKRFVPRYSPVIYQHLIEILKEKCNYQSAVL
jgi:branched-subunit amino acid aminotransferase/4-amino-4-deoxychorismate lyase